MSCLWACDPWGSASGSTVVSVDAAPVSGDAAPVSVDAAPVAVDAAPVAVDAAPVGVDPTALAEQARARYPTARHVSVEEAPFVVVAFADSPLFAEATRFLHRVVAAYSDGRFARMPSSPVYILLFFTSDAFAQWSSERYGPLGQGNLGSYQRDEREIAVDVSNKEKSLPTIAHEIAHPITEEDWADAAHPGRHIPTWFDECYASVFESPRWIGDAIHGAKWSRRWEILKNTLASPATAPKARPDRLFGISDDEFRGIDPAIGVGATLRSPALLAQAKERRLLNYSVARYTCLWLDDQAKLVPFYQAYRASFASDPTGKAAFERIVGKSPSEVQKAWAAWVPTPRDTVP